MIGEGEKQRPLDLGLYKSKENTRFEAREQKTHRHLYMWKQCSLEIPCHPVPPPPNPDPSQNNYASHCPDRQEGKGRRDFFHRMNLNFHHVPKYPWRGLGTKRSNRKEEQKPLIYILKSTYFYPRSGGHDRGKNSNLDQNYCPLRHQEMGKRFSYIRTSTCKQGMRTKWKNTM